MLGSWKRITQAKCALVHDQGTQTVKVTTTTQHMMVHRVTFSLTCLTSSTSSCKAVAVYRGLGKLLSKPSKAAGFMPACLFGSAQNCAWFILCVLPSLLQNNMLCFKSYKYSVALLRRQNALMTTDTYSATWGI